VVVVPSAPSGVMVIVYVVILDCLPKWTM
jgi:hypothetical protein